MLALLGRATLSGIIIAIIVLFLYPELRGQPLAINDPIHNTDAPLSLNYAIRSASPAVVNIYNRRYNDKAQLQLNTQSLGSGVIMSNKGYIMTNYHVVAQADQVIVALQDGQIFTAQLIGKDQRTDLAVLKIQADNLPVIPQNPSYTPTLGDIVLAIGNPYNLGQTTTFGIISATGRSGISFYGRQDFLQTDAAINDGNSGGALVNTLGELVGINTASFQQATDIATDGISFAIPYQLARTIMERIIADGRVIRGYIGIDGREINPIMARLYDVDQVHGVIVMNMAENGPAERAGFHKQDILIAINGEPISDLRNALDRVTDLRPGTQVPMTVRRNGTTKTLTVTIAHEPK